MHFFHLTRGWGWYTVYKPRASMCNSYTFSIFFVLLQKDVSVRFCTFQSKGETHSPNCTWWTGRVGGITGRTLTSILTTCPLTVSLPLGPRWNSNVATEVSFHPEIPRQKFGTGCIYWPSGKVEDKPLRRHGIRDSTKNKLATKLQGCTIQQGYQWHHKNGHVLIVSLDCQNLKGNYIDPLNKTYICTMTTSSSINVHWYPASLDMFENSF